MKLHFTQVDDFCDEATGARGTYRIAKHHVYQIGHVDFSPYLPGQDEPAARHLSSKRDAIRICQQYEDGHE